ncbi:hypothetical protein POVWA2_008580 [Plasmodium ovale wallikeri]|uniref:Uncharacterized protein n=1 Tax=Plasmodium ovale wallikeri TaxID=864142 RepID=A0A1A8YL32_PLAOA|nr:hypothetical protein POVWA1_008590 [Plasmodium ovale wallikeri]SBT32255.1 hypothetical protein POVWA2_008580 [Plasmodium ovale wallikeri]
MRPTGRGQNKIVKRCEKNTQNGGEGGVAEATDNEKCSISQFSRCSFSPELANQCNPFFHTFTCAYSSACISTCMRTCFQKEQFSSSPLRLGQSAK